MAEAAAGHDSESARKTGSQLTAAQRARKRANDREAQRNIRKRTKDHIAALESRLIDQRQQNDMLRERVAELELRLQRSTTRDLRSRQAPRSRGPSSTGRAGGDNSPQGLATLAWVAHPGPESWTSTSAYVPSIRAEVSTFENNPALSGLSLQTPSFRTQQGPPAAAYSTQSHLMAESDALGWASDSSTYETYDYLPAASFNHSTPASATSYMTGSPYPSNEQDPPDNMGLGGTGQNFLPPR